MASSLDLNQSKKEAPEDFFPTYILLKQCVDE